MVNAIVWFPLLIGDMKAALLGMVIIPRLVFYGLVVALCPYIVIALIRDTSWEKEETGGDSRGILVALLVGSTLMTGVILGALLYFHP